MHDGSTSHATTTRSRFFFGFVDRRQPCMVVLQDSLSPLPSNDLFFSFDNSIIPSLTGRLVFERRVFFSDRFLFFAAARRSVKIFERLARRLSHRDYAFAAVRTECYAGRTPTRSFRIHFRLSPREFHARKVERSVRNDSAPRLIIAFRARPD